MHDLWNPVIPPPLSSTTYFLFLSLSLHPSYSRLFLPPSKSSFLSVSLFLFLSICYPCLFQPRVRVSVLCTHNVCSIFLFISFILTSELQKFSLISIFLSCFPVQSNLCLLLYNKQFGCLHLMLNVKSGS